MNMDTRCGREAPCKQKGSRGWLATLTSTPDQAPTRKGQESGCLR